jgi:hypothetical protein
LNSYKDHSYSHSHSHSQQPQPQPTATAIAAVTATATAINTASHIRSHSHSLLVRTHLVNVVFWIIVLIAFPTRTSWHLEREGNPMKNSQEKKD